MFTIGLGRNGWFSKTKYWKNYQSGPMAGQQINIDNDEYDFWKEEAHALWGYLDFWGDFVPGLFNPELEDAMVI